MEKTLVLLKPCTLQRGLVGDVINRFERRGLRLAGMKMMQLTDGLLDEHYAHLREKPFFRTAVLVAAKMISSPLKFTLSHSLSNIPFNITFAVCSL